MADKIKKGFEEEAQKLRDFFKEVQQAKTSFGLSFPTRITADFAVANKALEDLESACRREYSKLIDPEDPEVNPWNEKQSKCMALFRRKDLGGVESNCGRNRGHKGEHSWYHDCWACEGEAGRHKASCSVIPTTPRK